MHRIARILIERRSNANRKARKTKPLILVTDPDWIFSRVLMQVQDKCSTLFFHSCYGGFVIHFAIWFPWILPFENRKTSTSVYYNQLLPAERRRLSRQGECHYIGRPLSTLGLTDPTPTQFPPREISMQVCIGDAALPGIYQVQLEMGLEAFPLIRFPSAGHKKLLHPK